MYTAHCSRHCYQAHDYISFCLGVAENECEESLKMLAEEMFVLGSAVCEEHLK